jgi:serine/threonine protein kinase
MMFLHGQKPKIIHRDLKCQNVLLNTGLTAKLTDFGESRADDSTMRTEVGTPYLMAPEVFTSSTGAEYTNAVDVYSFGMMLLEIFYDAELKKLAFNGLSAMAVSRKVLSGWRPDLSKVEAAEEEVARLIAMCWVHEPAERPTFMEISRFVKDNLLGAQATPKPAAARAVAVVEPKPKPKSQRERSVRPPKSKEEQEADKQMSGLLAMMGKSHADLSAA